VGTIDFESYSTGVDAMNKYGLTLVATLLFGSTLSAQEVTDHQESTETENVTATVEPKPLSQTHVSAADSQMSLYMEHQRRLDDPWYIIRQKAKQRAAQRQARIDAAKWYGHSPLRPSVSSFPHVQNYNPVVMTSPIGFIWAHPNYRIPFFYLQK
jgi:hypothetical protein